MREHMGASTQTSPALRGPLIAPEAAAFEQALSSLMQDPGAKERLGEVRQHRGLLRLPLTLTLTPPQPLALTLTLTLALTLTPRPSPNPNSNPTPNPSPNPSPDQVRLLLHAYARKEAVAHAMGQWDVLLGRKHARKEDRKQKKRSEAQEAMLLREAGAALNI